MEQTVKEPWLEEAVQLELPTGRVRYLLSVHREPCPHCKTGTRVSSVWATTARQAEIVEWCGHCFNAVCEALPLDAEQVARFAAVRAVVSSGKVSRKWHAARPALEDLERRGLL